MNLFPKLVFAMFIVAIILTSILGVSYVVNNYKMKEWLSHPIAPGKLYDVQNKKVYATVKGSGSTIIVLLTGLASASPEYWDLQDKLATQATVITYDRPGYSWSSQSSLSISLAEQSELLFELLMQISQEQQFNLNSNVLLVAQNYSSWIAKEFAKKHPELIKGLVLIDPMPLLKLVKTVPKDWLAPFFDQEQNLKRAITSSKIGFFRFLNLTPYDVPENIRPHVINNLASYSANLASYDEYSNLMSYEPNDLLYSLNPNIRVRVLYHSPRDHADLLANYSVPEDVAKQIENEWRTQAETWLKTSNNSQLIVAKNGLFALHLDQPHFIINSLQEFLK